METKHTPGPWTIATSFRGIYTSHPSPGPVQVCRAPEGFYRQWDINARLIAAAPELLDELLMLCNMLDGEQVSVGIEAQVCFARAVIAKALG